MMAVAGNKEPGLGRTTEEPAAKDLHKSKWAEYCGEYEHFCEDFRPEKVWMKGGEHYGKATNEETAGFTVRLYPAAGNEFIRKGGMVELALGEGSVIIDGICCKKL